MADRRDRDTFAVVVTLLILVALLVVLLVVRPVLSQPVRPASSEACFRPGPTSCEALVIREIGSAKRTVDFEAYALTDGPIVQALRDAAGRGVLVRSVTDRTSQLAGMLPGDVYTDCAVKIMHNKVVIVDSPGDGASVGFGSFNFSHAAEHHNAENHVWIHDASLAATFEAEFARLITASIKGVATCR